MENSQSRSNFIFGFVAGLGTIFTIGFFILLFSAMGDEDSSSSNRQAARPSVVENERQPSGDSMGGHEAGAPSGPAAQVVETDYVRGARDAKVSIIEYSDFECPFCQRFHPTVQQALDEYDGEVNWVYRHFPLSIHRGAPAKAEAAECAGELGGNDKFWEYTDMLFARAGGSGTAVRVADLPSMAAEIGINEADFSECLDSGRHAAKVTAAFNEGLSLGVTGTPGSIIVGPNGETRLVSGAVPYQQLKQVIDSMLN